MMQQVNDEKLLRGFGGGGGGDDDGSDEEEVIDPLATVLAEAESEMKVSDRVLQAWERLTHCLLIGGGAGSAGGRRAKV